MEDKPSTEIKFHYIKANDFRVISATGVWGGTTPRGNISMSFFTERTPIPKTISHELTEEGKLGAETNRDLLEGVIRDVHINVMVDLPFASSLRDWLDDKIAELEKRAVTDDNEESAQ